MLITFIAIVIGIITGIVQFYLLQKFTGAVTMGKITNKTVIFAITQFLFPFAVLVACAFTIGDRLLWVGIGIAASLITCAIIKFITVARSNKTNK